MKRLFIGIAALFSVQALCSAAQPVVGTVQINPVHTPQSGGFNTQTGTVGTFTATSVNVTGLTAGQCLQVGANGLLTTTGAQCVVAGSGTVPTYQVYVANVQSSPTVTTGFLAPYFLGTVVGSSMVIRLDGSSVTLQGNNLPATYLTNSSATVTYLLLSSATLNYIHNQSTQQSATANISSMTVYTQLGTPYMSVNQIPFVGSGGALGGSANAVWFSSASALVIGGGTYQGFGSNVNINGSGTLLNLVASGSGTARQSIQNDSIGLVSVISSTAASISLQNVASSGPSNLLTIKSIGGNLLSSDPSYADMTIGHGGVMIRPTATDGSSVVVSTPVAPLHIGNGATVPNPTNTKVAINYPGDGFLVVINTATGSQFMAGVQSTWTVVGSTTSGTDVHIVVGGSDKIVAHTNSVDFNGTGDGALIATIGTSSYTAVVSSYVITAGHLWGMTTNYTAYDYGASGASGSGSVVPGAVGQLAYYPSAGTSVSGATGTVITGSSITVMIPTVHASTLTVTTGTNGVSGNSTRALVDVYLGALSNGYLMNLGSANQTDQVLVQDQQPVSMVRYGATLGTLEVGYSGTTSASLIYNGALGSKLNLWNSGEVDLQSDTSGNGGTDIVLLPQTVEAMRVSNTGGVIIKSTTTFQRSMGIRAPSTDAFEFASSTTTTFYHVLISTNGHVISSGTLPTISTCGTTPNGSVVGNDHRGVITIGGGSVTACTLTFMATYGTGCTVSCVISDSLTTTTPDVSVTPTTMTLGFSASIGGGSVHYDCEGVGSTCK